MATTSSESSAASASAGTVTLPSSLSGLTAAAASDSEIDLSWTDVTGATGYEIDRKDSSGDWEAIDAVDSRRPVTPTPAWMTALLIRTR